jgi:RNA polymerase sigma-70 factor (ECF subfamily)
VDRSDGELVHETRRGDKEAFREIVERYQRKIIAVALGMVHNREDAIEIAQETFVKAFENLDKFKGESSLYTWLYRIVVNLGIDFRRRDKRHGTVALADRPGGGEDVPFRWVARVDVPFSQLRASLDARGAYCAKFCTTRRHPRRRDDRA